MLQRTVDVIPRMKSVMSVDAIGESSCSPGHLGICGWKSVRRTPAGTKIADIAVTAIWRTFARRSSSRWTNEET
jgi:hypothetical protein